MQQSSLTAQCLAEFLGTFLFLFFGIGCVAALKLVGVMFGQWEIGLVWGLAVALGVYLTAGVSGAHLNPAVTIALWLFACFERRKVLPYVIAQMAGAFFAAALVYLLYYAFFLHVEAASLIERGSRESLAQASIFSTYPHAYLSWGQAFLVEVVISAILLVLIFALTDDGNGVPRGALAPLLIGLVVAVIGATFGPLTGFAMNPARDFGPKLFAYFAGWGKIALTGGYQVPYFIVPIIAPIIGGILGAMVYRLCFTKYLPCSDNQQTKASK